MLTQEYLKSVLWYDPSTGIFIWTVGRRRISAGTIAGSPDKDGYIRIKVNGKRYGAHRLAIFYMTGEWPVNETDHKNRIRDDNKWDNLKDATNEENRLNRGIQHNSRFMGQFIADCIFCF